MRQPETQHGEHILCVVGARPNFMKMAPILRAIKAPGSGLTASLVHTGQHYDHAMNSDFFRQLGLPAPDVNLEVGSASHTVQTARIMERFEPVLERLAPAAVLVVGDVNSTIACALVAARNGVPVIHVEAGLRSGDRSMPEEINRILTDQLSTLLFTTEATAGDNLRREGIAESRIFFVGNVMIDSLRDHMKQAQSVAETLKAAGANATDYPDFGLLTLHRPANVDDPAVLEPLLRTLVELSRKTPLIFPLHPRTRAGIARAGLETLVASGDILLLPPQGYREMLGLMREAKLVLTDSGGIQEETTALGVPCLTLRTNTERPVTIHQGTNTLVGTSPDAIRRAHEAILRGAGKAGRQPDLWDGAAAERIVEVIARWRRLEQAA